MTSSDTTMSHPRFRSSPSTVLAIEMLYGSLLVMTAALSELGVHTPASISRCMNWMNPGPYHTSVGHEW